MIRVLVVAEQPVVRAGLEAMLREDGRFAIVRSPEPADVVVVDGEAPEQSAPIVLLAEDRAAAWRGALDGGVRAVLRRDVTAAELCAAIEAVSAGLAVLHAEDAAAVVHAPSLAVAGTDEELTPREVEVLRMMAEGLGNKTIAWRLGISEHTVKFHVASILAKLHASGRTEAVMSGVRRGLVMI